MNDTIDPLAQHADEPTEERLHQRAHSLTDVDRRLLMVLAQSDNPDGMSCLEVAVALRRCERSVRRRRRALLNYGFIYVETKATWEPGGMVLTTFGRRAAELLQSGASVTMSQVGQ